jgi:phage shock protein PspC (stress-responsive transcriptional regulator)
VLEVLIYISVTAYVIAGCLSGIGFLFHMAPKVITVPKRTFAYVLFWLFVILGAIVSAVWWPGIVLHEQFGE